MRFRGPGVSTLLLPSFPGLHLAPASTPPADAKGIWYDLQAPGIWAPSAPSLFCLVMMQLGFCRLISSVSPGFLLTSAGTGRMGGRKGDRDLLPPVRGCSVSIAPAATFHPAAALSRRNSWFISSFFPHPPTQLAVSATGTSMSRPHIPPHP